MLSKESGFYNSFVDENRGTSKRFLRTLEKFLLLNISKDFEVIQTDCVQMEECEEHRFPPQERPTNGITQGAIQQSGSPRRFVYICH